jgi:molecular chaperone HscB
MTAAPLDPFQVFGIDRTLDLDERELERRYLRLSRECHPDLNRAAETADCLAVLQRAAEINDAWRVLRDRWERARALLEHETPGILEQTKVLAPGFLLEAMSDAEAVAEADLASVPDLRRRLETRVDASWQEIVEALRRADREGAAVAFQKARYHRKALADLEART